MSAGAGEPSAFSLRDELLAKAIEVLTAAARLTRPVLEQDSSVCRSAGGEAAMGERSP